MKTKLILILSVAFSACSSSVDSAPDCQSQQPAITELCNLPSGCVVVEQHPEGYFVRIASVERVDEATIRAIANTYNGKFDRIDLCLHVAHERGDEYLSVMDGKVFDYDNDNIYSLNHISE